MKLSAWDAYNQAFNNGDHRVYMYIYIYIPVLLLLLLLFARIFNEPRNEGSLSLSLSHSLEIYSLFVY